MENLHGRRREVVNMTETNLGDIVQDFHWMMGTDLHLCQQEKAPMGVVTYHTLVLLHIVLLD